jgi:hypothetical protein
MKIAFRYGHNSLCRGAVGILDETTENRNYGDRIVGYLREEGIECIDCTPCDNSSSSQELSEGVSNANSSGADLFISFHLNKAYDSYEGAIGSEVWVYPGTDLTTEIGNRILERLSEIGFKNRGVKTSTGFYELNSTNMSAMIIEGFFVEATEDVELYQERFDDFCRGIAEGIVGYTINPAEPVDPVTPVVPDNNLDYNDGKFRVRIDNWGTIENIRSQKGAFDDLDNAKDLCNTLPDYFVFDCHGVKMWQYVPPVEPIEPIPVPLPTTKEKLQGLIDEMQEIVNNM